MAGKNKNAKIKYSGEELENILKRLKEQGLLTDTSVANLRKRLKKKLREERRQQAEKIEGLKQELAQIQLRLNN